MILSADGHNWLHTPDDLKTALSLTIDAHLKEPSHDLGTAVEGNDKRAKFLFKGYKRFLTTIQQYADKSATYTDMKKRYQGFTNLKLFLTHGGDLHSTSRGNKLMRTVARIPENVLKNASENVTYKDYAAADYLKQEKGKLPLLSFHGYKATGSLFGMGKHSQAYREKLRAITASAQILGGVETAVKVKELLSEIDGLPNMGKGGKKEDVVDRILKSLETQSDPDTLVSELNFELQRHKLAQRFNVDTVDANLSEIGLIDEADQGSASVGDELQKLDGVPNRVTVFENLNTNIRANADGYTLEKPNKLLHDLRFITQPGDPVANALKPRPVNRKTARQAIHTWANLMTKKGSAVRNNIESEMKKIEQSNDSKESDKMYLRAAEAFADIDKSDLSADDQCALLLRCLKDPSARQSENLGTGNLKDDIKTDEPQVEEERPKKKDTKAKATENVSDQPVKTDIPLDTGDMPVVDPYGDDDVFGDL